MNMKYLMDQTGMSVEEIRRLLDTKNQNINSINGSNIDSTVQMLEGTKVNSQFDDFPKVIKKGKQELHIEGTSNYKNGHNKSIINGTVDDAQALVNKFPGIGTAYGNKEVVDAGSIIGKYYDLSNGKYVETSRFTIHYSNKGTHIVPAPPNP